jgi:hypothetical protein
VDELKKRRFLWGVALAWVPWIPILMGVGHAFKGISEQKATGLGAIVAELTEVFVVCGVGAFLIGQIIILLSRAFLSGHWVRSLFSVLSLCLSGVMLLLVGLFSWLTWFSPSGNFY